MLDDYTLARENIFSNFQKNIMMIQALCTQMGKASYLLASKEQFFAEKGFSNHANVLGLFLLVLRLVLVKRYISIFSQDEIGILKDPNTDVRQLTQAIEGIMKNDEVYSKYFFDYVKNLMDTNTKEYWGDAADDAEFARYLDNALMFEHQKFNTSIMKSLIPNRGLLFRYLLPFIDSLLYVVLDTKAPEDNMMCTEILLLADHILDFLVFFTVLKDLLNGSNVPFLKDFMNQTAQSKELLTATDLEIGVLNIQDKKKRILSLISAEAHIL